MAEDYDPEVMRDLMGNLDALNASLGPLATRMGQLSGAIDAQGNAINKEGEAIKKATSYREGESKAVQATRQANLELEKAALHLKQGFSKAGDAAISFSDALLKGEGKFSAYNKALDGAGEAAWQLGKAFGPLGFAIGGAIKAITKVAQLFTEQADAQNEFVGEMYKMGAIAGQNSDKLTDMARAAGFAAEDLNKLVPIFKKAGSGLTALGGTSSEGATAFGSLLKAARENERAFYRIGYSLEELQETQADYLELQRLSGINLRQRGFDEAKLAADSLKYAKNLRELSDLTGQSAETLKQEQMSARNAYENVVANRVEEAKIRQMETELANTTDQARRDQLQKEIDEMKNSSAVRNEAIGRMANDFGSEFGAQFGKVLRTGAFDESTRGLAVLGISAADLQKRFEGLEEGSPEFDRVMAETAQEIREKQDQGMLSFGQSLQFGGEELGRALGLAREAIMRGAMIDPQDEVGRRRAVRDATEATQAGGDAQRDAAAALIATERNIRTAADKALDSLNPLTNGFDKGTIALQALTVAAGIAATAMIASAVAGRGGIGKIASRLLGRGGTSAGSGAGAARATSALTNLRTPVSRGAALRVGAGAGVVAAGMGVYEAIGEGRERSADIRAREQAGLISEEEARRARRASSAKTTGQSIGVAGGALAGGAKGALIGAALGPVGALVGGLIGAGLGAWAGKNAGKLIGGAIGEGIGESVKNQDFGELVKQDSATLDAMRATGASDEEISHMERQLELNHQLAQAQEAQDYELMSLLITQKELNDARLSGTPEEIQELEKLINLQKDISDQKNDLIVKENLLNNLKDIANPTEQQKRLIANLEKEIELKKESLAVTQEEANEIQKRREEEEQAQQVQARRLELQQQISALEAEKEEKGGSFGSRRKLETRRKNRELEDAKKELEKINQSSESTEQTTSGSSETPATPAGGGTDFMAMAGEGAASGVSGSPTAETDPDSSPADRLEQDPAKQQLISSKPDNVKVGPKADLTGVDNQLLAKFFTAAQDYGKDVTVNSAFRGDQYQAQLWVRGRILGERGIHTPARPKNTTKINYKGKDYTVEGSGRGSKHREGDALDISGNRGALDPFLARYGLVRPYKREDPPHVEMIKAKEGGMAQGPNEGYLAELHSNEMIVPLDKNSILAKLGKTPAGTAMQDMSGIGMSGVGSLVEKLGKPIGGSEDTNEEGTSAGDAEVYAMLSSKLDTMIEKLDGQNGDMVGVLEKHLSQMVSKLDDSNDLQGKMLQYSKV